MAHSLFAYGFLEKAVKKELFLGKSGESLNCVQEATADVPPLPSYLGWGQGSSCQSRALIPSKWLLMENVISGTRSYFLISFFLPTSDFIFFQLHLCKFGLVWDTIDKHNVKAIPVEPCILWTNYEKNITKAREEKQHGQTVHNIKAMVFLLTLSIML